MESLELCNISDSDLDPIVPKLKWVRVRVQVQVWASSKVGEALMLVGQVGRGRFGFNWGSMRGQLRVSWGSV
jgi:hypothetical protein